MATKAAKKAGKSLPGPSTSSVNKPVSAADHTKETEINLGEEFQIVGNKINKRPHSRNDENQVTRDESKTRSYALHCHSLCHVSVCDSLTRLILTGLSIAQRVAVERPGVVV
jgi:hypothetical protein